MYNLQVVVVQCVLQIFSSKTLSTYPVLISIKEYIKITRTNVLVYLVGICRFDPCHATPLKMHQFNKPDDI